MFDKTVSRIYPTNKMLTRLYAQDERLLVSVTQPMSFSILLIFATAMALRSK